jgi:flagellar protein FliS
MFDARTLYRESVVRGASPLRLVVLLYEQMVEDLRRAANAIAENQVETRTHAINHALLVLGHLQGQLNREAGGEVAHNLNLFYNVLRQKLQEVHFQPSLDLLQRQIALLLELRDAWTEADRRETARSTTVSAPLAEPALGTASHAHADWKG